MMTKKPEDKIPSHGIIPENNESGYGFMGTLKGDDANKEKHLQKIAPHVKRALDSALKAHKARDEASLNMFGGKPTMSMDHRKTLSVTPKMCGHFLDSTHGRHIAAALNDKVKHSDDPGAMKHRAQAFVRSYHPSQFESAPTETGDMLLEMGACSEQVLLEMPQHHVECKVSKNGSVGQTKSVRIKASSPKHAIEFAKKHYGAQGYQILDTKHIQTFPDRKHALTEARYVAHPGRVLQALQSHGVHADSVGKDKHGNVVVRKGYFYRHGTAEGFHERVTSALTAAGIKHDSVDHGDHYAAFNGGQGVAKNSHYWSKVKLHEEIMNNIQEGYKVGDKVIPKIGPHAGKVHEVIHVHDDGAMNIKPKDPSVTKIKYHLGAARAQPEHVSLCEDASMLPAFAASVAAGVHIGTKINHHIFKPGGLLDKVKSLRNKKPKYSVRPRVFATEGVEIDLPEIELIEDFAHKDAADTAMAVHQKRHPNAQHSVIQGRRSGRWHVVRHTTGGQHIVEDVEDIGEGYDDHDLNHLIKTHADEHENGGGSTASYSKLHGIETHVREKYGLNALARLRKNTNDHAASGGHGMAAMRAASENIKEGDESEAEYQAYRKKWLEDREQQPPTKAKKPAKYVGKRVKSLLKESEHETQEDIQEGTKKPLGNIKVSAKDTLGNENHIHIFPKDSGYTIHHTNQHRILCSLSNVSKEHQFGYADRASRLRNSLIDAHKTGSKQNILDAVHRHCYDHNWKIQ